MGSRSGFDADLELDELQNVVDRGSGAIAVTQRQANAQANLGLIGLVGGASGGAPLEQVTAETYAVLTADYTMLNQTAAQKALNASANGAITLAAGLWGFEGQYVINETGSTSHTVSTLFGGTAVLTFMTYTVYGISISGGATPAAGGLSGAGLSAAAVVVTPALAAAGDEVIAFYGTVLVGTAGTLIPQVSYSAAPGAAPTMKKGSYVFFQPLNSNLVGAWS